MANSDRNIDLMKEDFGTVCLITDRASEYFLNKSKCSDCQCKKVPENRYSRPCGGKGGFDDYVERWH